MHDRVGFESLLIPIPVKAHTQQTVLRSPVAQVVQTGHLPAHRLVQVGDHRANNGRSQVTGMERLGDIGRGKVNQHVLAITDLVVGAERFSGGGRVGSGGERA